jgi:hypothetical protein
MVYAVSLIHYTNMQLFALENVDFSNCWQCVNFAASREHVLNLLNAGKILRAERLV